MKTKTWFLRFSKSLSVAAGNVSTFTVAVALIVAWAVTGPFFGYSDTWQLIINTTTTIITFLMVFLIQNTQNRDTEAIQVKLDEIIRAIEGAHNELLNVENLDEEDLDNFRQRYEKLAIAAKDQLKNGLQDTDCPDVIPSDKV